jgi:integrase
VATPFDGITLHTLRRTCVGWLRASNLPVEVIAQRLGHNDGGATLLRHYRYVREGEARAALDRLGAGVRAYLDELEDAGEKGEEQPE